MKSLILLSALSASIAHAGLITLPLSFRYHMLMNGWPGVCQELMNTAYDTMENIAPLRYACKLKGDDTVSAAYRRYAMEDATASMQLMWDVFGPFSEFSCEQVAVEAAKRKSLEAAVICHQNGRLSSSAAEELLMLASQNDIPDVFGILMSFQYTLSRTAIDNSLKAASEAGHKHLIDYIIQLPPYPSQAGINYAFQVAKNLEIRRRIVLDVVTGSQNRRFDLNFARSLRSAFYGLETQLKAREQRVRRLPGLIDGDEENDETTKKSEVSGKTDAIPARHVKYPSVWTLSRLESLPEDLEVRFDGFDEHRSLIDRSDSMQQRAQTRQKLNVALLQAVKQGSFRSVHDLVRKGAQPRFQDSAALRHACFWSLTDIATLLIEHGAEITARRGECLKFTALNANKDLTTFLLVQSKQGLTSNFLERLDMAHVETYREALGRALQFA